MRPKQRELHELPYREIVKSGTIRLASLEWNFTLILPALSYNSTIKCEEKVQFRSFINVKNIPYTLEAEKTLFILRKFYILKVDIFNLFKI